MTPKQQYKSWRLAPAVVLLVSAMSVAAGEQAERALAGVRALLASGEIKRDAVLKVAFKPGNINALLGPDLALQKEWEQRTGVMISARVIPQQPALVNLKSNPDIDLTVARTHEFPDLVDQSLVADLTPLVKEYGLAMDAAPPNGFVRPRLQAYFGDKVVAIPADGDVTLFYLRRDLLEDPKEKTAFRRKFGRELAMPRTWAEYDQLVAFFHRPEQGLYGASEERDQPGGWMYWLPRYYTQATPFKRLFDDQMKPLIDSPAGVAATESYLRTVRYSPPEILNEGRDYSYVLPLFMQGKSFSTSNTIAGAKLFNSAVSAVRGKFMAIPMPGTVVGGKLLRHNMPIYGNNLVVSAASPHRKLAFLFLMWLTDHENSVRTVGVAGGHTDPFRWNHLADARLISLYSADALKVFRAEWDVALPPGTGIPGDGDYLASLDRHLWLAARGEISAAEAMKRTAGEWEKLTEQRGREKQAAYWRAFMASFDDPEKGAASRAFGK